MDPPSRILLLLITNLPHQFPLTNQYLHELFEPYGELLKILIFERGKTNKVFVEYVEVKSAIKARDKLNFKSVTGCSGKYHFKLIHFNFRM